MIIPFFFYSESKKIRLLLCKVKVKMSKWNGKTLLSCGHSVIRMLNTLFIVMMHLWI